MNITYKRINKSAGKYEVFIDEKNVGIIIGQTRKWVLKNLFGTSVSKGITRDIAVKNALDNLWNYELEFGLFNCSENYQEENLEDSFVKAGEENDSQISPNVPIALDQISPENASFLNLNKEKEVGEPIKIIEENNISDSSPKLGDDYQPMEKESNLNKCTRIINNSLTKIREYASKIGIY